MPATQLPTERPKSTGARRRSFWKIAVVVYLGCAVAAILVTLFSPSGSPGEGDDHELQAQVPVVVTTEEARAPVEMPDRVPVISPIMPSTPPATAGAAPNMHGVASLAEVAERLDTHFERDGPPDMPMLDARETFAGYFDDAEIDGARLKDMECKASICRGEIEFEDLDRDRAFANRVFLDMHKSAELGLAVSVPRRVRHDDGSVSATVYLFKPTTNPSVDPGDEAVAAMEEE